MKINKYTTVLVKDKGISYPAETANSAQAANDILCRLFKADRLPSERVWQVCTNTKLGTVGAFEVGSGSQGRCIVDVQGIARNALLTGAAGVIIAHNHPSGDSYPSEDDDKVTKKVQRALDLLDIQLLEHIIITQNGYYSFKEHGRI